MKWSDEADRAIRKVPFFVRKKVRKKVEAFAEQKGKETVELADVKALKKKFLSRDGMESQIKGYDVSSCFGAGGCPNTACSASRLVEKIEETVKKEDLLSFLKSNVTGGLKFHHEFRIVVAECPNACSRPQIADIGIIGAALPRAGDEPCTLCGSCVDACAEAAVSLDEDRESPVIDPDKCLACGKCIRECPTGTLETAKNGFRVQLGGRLGRHPRLAMEIPGILSEDEVLDIVQKALRFYKRNSKNGRRFSHLLNSVEEAVHSD